MRSLSTYSLGVEKEKEKARISESNKKAGTSESESSGAALQRGDDFGTKAGERNMFENGFEYNNWDYMDTAHDLSANPWVSTSSISTVTLRSRHLVRSSSHNFGYSYDEEDSQPYASNSKQESDADTRRRRRRSRSAASMFKHPLYMDMDGDVNGHGRAEKHFHRTYSETQSFSSHRGVSSPSDHQTRPSLRRAIGSLEGRTDEETDKKAQGTERPGDLDVDVIVHRVARTDTLAGIALKYNIPLAQLRKANKLWTNDSIHLRPVLYIPLRDVASSPLSKLLSSKSDTSLSPGGHYKPPSQPDLEYDAGNQLAASQRDIAINAHDEIRRVPHSELSFFPSSGASASNSSITMTHSRSIPNTQRAYSSNTNVSSSPAFSFTTLLHGLNTATQEIKSRLSLDSYSSKHSSDPGEDGEIELSAVKRDRIRELAGVGVAESPSTSAFPPDTPTISSEHKQHPPPHLFFDSSISSSLPYPSPSTPQKAVIRSVQLQPSPEMKIPNTAKPSRFVPEHREQAAVDSDTE